MVAGAGVGRVPLQPADGFPRRVHQRVLDLIRARVERGGLVLVAALTGLPGRDPVGGVQHRHALDRADGHVEVRHRCGSLPRSAARTSASSVALAYGCAARYAATAPASLRGRLGLAALPGVPRRADVLLVQAADHARSTWPHSPSAAAPFPAHSPAAPRRGVVADIAPAQPPRPSPRWAECRPRRRPRVLHDIS